MSILAPPCRRAVGLVFENDPIACEFGANPISLIKAPRSACCSALLNSRFNSRIENWVQPISQIRTLQNPEQAATTLERSLKGSSLAWVRSFVDFFGKGAQTT